MQACARRERALPADVNSSKLRQLFYYPMVAFNLPDGRRRTVQIAEGSWPPAYEVGQAVTVAYNPDQPRNARIQSLGGTIGLWTVSIITGVLGVAFALATLLARWILKQSPPDLEME